jgi:hypothetical protein
VRRESEEGGKGGDTGFFDLYIGWGEVKGQGGVKERDKPWIFNIYGLCRRNFHLTRIYGFYKLSYVIHESEFSANKVTCRIRGFGYRDYF